MQYLFCKNKTAGNEMEHSYEQVFFSRSADESVIALLKGPKNSIDRILRKYRFLKRWNILKWILFGVAEIILISLLCDAVFNGIDAVKQSYRNAPWIFWLGGCALVLASLLFFLEYYAKRQIKTDCALKKAEQKLRNAWKTVYVHMGVPEDAVRADILRFPCCYDENGQAEACGTAQLDEYRFWNENDCLCAFDGKCKYMLPHREMTGLHLIEDQPLFAENWNKDEPRDKKKYLHTGVSPEGVLSFFCALELTHEEEPCRLLFPAYELPVFSALTGFPVPALPIIKKKN